MSVKIKTIIRFKIKEDAPRKGGRELYIVSSDNIYEALSDNAYYGYAMVTINFETPILDGIIAELGDTLKKKIIGLSYIKDRDEEGAMKIYGIVLSMKDHLPEEEYSLFVES